MKNNKNKLRCSLSGRLINNSEEVVKVKYAVEYLEKMGYKIIKPQLIAFIYTMLSVFVVLGAILLATPTVSAINLDDYVFIENKSFNGFSGMSFNPNGTKLFIASRDIRNITQYNCNIPFNLNSCVFYDSIGIPAETRDIYFHPNGNYIYGAERNNELIYQYNCNDSFNISSCYNSGEQLLMTYEYNRETSEPQGVYMSENGDYVIVSSTYYSEIEEISPSINKMSCSDNFNISSCYNRIERKVIMTEPDFLGDFFFNHNGEYLIVWNASGSATFPQSPFELMKYKCNIPYNLTTCDLTTDRIDFNSVSYSNWGASNNIVNDSHYFIQFDDNTINSYALVGEINIFSPLNDSVYNSEEINFNFELLNYTADIKNMSIILNNEIVYFDESGNKNYNLNLSLKNGEYETKINFYDVNDNMVESETINFIIDNKIDIFETKLNQTDVKYGNNITLLYSINDSYGMERCYYVYATEEHNISCGMYKSAEIETIEAIEEFNEIKVYGIDNNGNTESQTLLFNEPKSIFYIDLDKESNVTLLVLLFIVGVLMFFLYAPLSAIIFIILGFILLFSEINIIISFLLIVIGVYISFTLERSDD